ncbi:MAG TPA: hypothetical protein VK509_02555 [Polyangiales bacterium]|nr:hypothetical protein [Polyangiales bacterium]
MRPRPSGSVRAALLLAALGCASTAVATSAHAAEPAAPGLNWLRLEGADACISAAQLARAVEAKVGRALFAPAPAAALFVDGSVRLAAPDRWQVELGVSSPDGRVLGRRALEFTGSDCHAIDEAVALVIAVTLYPNTGLPEFGIPLAPGTAASLDVLFGNEPTDPLASEPARGTEPAESERAWRIAVDATAATGVGQLPGAAFGLAAHVRLTPPGAWPFELGALGFLPATQDAGDAAIGRGRFQLLLGSLATCPTQTGTRLSLGLCAGAELGRLRVQPEGFAEPGEAVDDAIANLFGTAVLRVAFGRVPYLRVALIGLLPLMQRSYTYQAPDGSPARVFRMPQGAARAELGMGAAF